jgi:hypothetical protein
MLLGSRSGVFDDAVCSLSRCSHASSRDWARAQMLALGLGEIYG